MLPGHTRATASLVRIPWKAFYDANGNGQPDPGEAEATAAMSWVPPAAGYTSVHWAGYASTQATVHSLFAQIVVPAVPSTCASSSFSSFWIGYNGFLKNTTYLPQIG